MRNNRNDMFISYEYTQIVNKQRAKFKNRNEKAKYKRTNKWIRGRNKWMNKSYGMKEE